MSRHNRRRNRGGHKSSLPNHNSMDLSTVPPLEPIATLGFHQSSLVASKSLPSHNTHRNNASARHWHNRYMAWQARERRQREEKASLEAEKKRIFGDADDDSNGDDEELCKRMMEYFVGLDFIEL